MLCNTFLLSFGTFTCMCLLVLLAAKSRYRCFLLMQFCPSCRSLLTRVETNMIQISKELFCYSVYVKTL